MVETLCSSKRHFRLLCVFIVEVAHKKKTAEGTLMHVGFQHVCLSLG